MSKKDVVSVVRCSDCTLKYLKGMQMFCSKMVNPVTPNGYCSYGRKVESQEDKDDDM